MLFAKRAGAKASQAQHVRELEAQIAAMERSQAVIEFKPDGTVIRANANFLGAMGYSAGEVEGRHHSMFVTPEEAQSSAYREFWKELNRGEFVARKFRRIGKTGGEVWIQASYNPVLDETGKPYKVIKFATDVTEMELERARTEEERRLTQEEQSAVVSTLAEGLRRLSQGDLTAEIEAEFNGGYRQIRADFNSAINAVREAIGAISATTTTLRGGSDEIASASDDLSRRTERQAASLEETAAALDEITAAVKRSAEVAKQGFAAASDARLEAERSGEVVREAVAAMGEIDQSSRQITRIIGVIDEIAFQTNLLALNAGVEAARAGEAGRGFAVVASEVRALAQRSAEAAKEIKVLISTSSDQVERGVKLVADAGTALTGIVTKVAEIDQFINAIALSAQEQATGLNQVNTAVNEMDHVTQQNAAMVEEATAAAASLRGDAVELARLVAQFHTGQERQAGRPELAVPGRQASGRNPVAQARARISVFAGGAAAKEWEEF